jgi:ubiquinone/menaquinone biosynthesis C-methylase UbiE
VTISEVALTARPIETGIATPKMPSYDEAEDVRQHLEDVAAMDARLEGAGVKVNWAEATVLDLGAAGGIHAGVVAARAKRLHAADTQDQNVRWNGEFVKLLSEKFSRHGLKLPISRIEFDVADAQFLMYRDGWFDTVVSFNAFEHIQNPALALAEVGRVLKRGGVFYTSFDPLWTADTGSHFSHRVPEPWAHLFLSDAEFIARMTAAGAPEEEVRDFRHAMNRWRLNQFNELFQDKALGSGLNLVWMTSWKGVSKQENMAVDYFDELKKRYSEDELLTRSMSAVFVRI